MLNFVLKSNFVQKHETVAHDNLLFSGNPTKSDPQTIPESITRFSRNSPRKEFEELQGVPKNMGIQ